LKELSILKLFTENREQAEQYGVYLRNTENLEPSIALLNKCIQEYYNKYPEHNYIGEDEFHSFYDYLYPNNRERNLHLELINRMYALDVSTDIMTDLLEQSMEKYHASVIVSKLIPVLEGRTYDVLPYIQSDLDKFVNLMKNPPKSLALEPITMLPSELVENKATLEGAPWHLETLTSILGPLTLGTLGVIFAYVDGGKTSFALSALKHFARYYKDTKETLVYACNEESGIRVSERLTSAFTGKSYVELYDQYRGRQDSLNEELAEQGWHRIKVIDGIKHVSQIKRILDEWGPVCMFIDQGTKVATDSKAEGVGEVRYLYNSFRDLGNEYNCAMVAVEQAIGDAENKQWITLADIYGSRVAIQGELDYAIGIGKKLEKGREDFRYVNISKNKLKDGITSAFTTFFDKPRCVFRAT
jgi:hypothetical protein